MLNTENSKEALEYLVDTGKKFADGKLLYEDETRCVYGFRDETGQIHEHTIYRPYKTDHQFNSIDSVISFLKSKFVKSQDTVLFINRLFLEVRQNYPSDNFQKGIMHFNACPEFSLIKSFGHGIDQAKLLKHLQTDLSGCIDGRLALDISSIQIKNKSETAVDIHPSGLSDKGTIQQMTISFPKAKGEGTEDKELKLDWDYVGPVIDGLDVDFTAKLRLFIEFNAEKGLVFTFKIIREELFFREILDCIIAKIKPHIPEKIEIYEGSFVSKR